MASSDLTKAVDKARDHLRTLTELAPDEWQDYLANIDERITTAVRSGDVKSLRAISTELDFRNRQTGKNKVIAAIGEAVDLVLAILGISVPE